MQEEIDREKQKVLAEQQKGQDYMRERDLLTKNLQKAISAPPPPSLPPHPHPMLSTLTITLALPPPPRPAALHCTARLRTQTRRRCSARSATCWTSRSRCWTT